MAELSPAAQAVLDAFENASDGEYVEGVWVVNERTMLAAALRAAADQVVPHPVHPSVYMDCCEYTDMQTRVGTRADILAIAAELESTNG